MKRPAGTLKLGTLKLGTLKLGRSWPRVSLFGAAAGLTLGMGCGVDTSAANAPSGQPATAEPSAPAEPPAPPPCTYPEAGDSMVVGQALPLYSWLGARQPGGVASDFSLQDFACDAAWDGYDSLTFAVVPAW